MKKQVNRKRDGRTEKRSWNWPTIVLLMGGVLLLAAALVAAISAPSAAKASATYKPAEVAREKPIVAVHEMGESGPIPFLPRNEPQPKIQVSETSYNFGSMGPQDVVEREFVVRNVGDAPLTISRAYTTCGCTTAEFSASVIPPGQVATIRLVFDAGYHDAAGQTVRRGLIIENNDPEQSQAEIWIQATVLWR